MSATSTARLGAMAAESRMGAANGTSDLIAFRLTGAKVLDADGRQVPEWVQVHAGPCRIGGVSRGASPTARKPLPGGDLQVASRVAHLPIAVTVIRDGDLLSITAGESAGTVWRVLESDPYDQRTACRLPVVAEKRPTEWGPP